MITDESELAPFEEHLLACASCAERAEEAQDCVDLIRAGIIAGGYDQGYSRKGGARHPTSEATDTPMVAGTINVSPVRIDGMSRPLLASVEAQSGPADPQ
jgi:hypothetical protein